MSDIESPVRWFPQPASNETLEDVTLQSWIRQAVGAASACWDDLSEAGLFHSDEAARIASSLHEHVQQVIEDVIAGTRAEFADNGMKEDEVRAVPVLSERERAMMDARRNLVQAEQAIDQGHLKRAKQRSEVAFGHMRWAELLKDSEVAFGSIEETAYNAGYRDGLATLSDRGNINVPRADDLVVHWLQRERGKRESGSAAYSLLDQLLYDYQQHAIGRVPLGLELPEDEGPEAQPA